VHVTEKCRRRGIFLPSGREGAWQKGFNPVAKGGAAQRGADFRQQQKLKPRREFRCVDKLTKKWFDSCPKACRDKGKGGFWLSKLLLIN
jgi:hypothetical protein